LNGDALDYKWWSSASEKTELGGEIGEIVQTQNIRRVVLDPPTLRCARSLGVCALSTARTDTNAEQDLGPGQ